MLNFFDTQNYICPYGPSLVIKLTSEPSYILFADLRHYQSNVVPYSSILNKKY